jgi:hypothetical protein
MGSEELYKPKKSHRGWWIAAGVIVLAAAILALLWLNGKYRLQRKIAQLHAKGYPISLEELNQRRKLPEGTPNAADIYEKAFIVYQEPSYQDWKLVPYIGTAQLLEWGEPLPNQAKAAIERILTSNRKTLDLVNQAVAIPDCAFLLLPSRFPMGNTTPVGPLMACDKLVFLEGIERIEANDLAGTMAIVRNRIRLAEALSRHPFPLEYAIHTAIFSGTIVLIEQVMSHPSTDENILMELDELLGRSVSTMIQEAYRNECLYLLACLKDPSLTGWMMKTNFVKRKVAVLNIYECLDQLEHLVDISGWKGHERFQQIEQIKKNTENLSVFHVMTRSYIPFILKDMETDVKFQTRLDSVRTAIAIERYRLETNKLPEGLDSLVPKYIEKIPIDPYDGKPLRYKRLEKGYTVYSIGLYGGDNGGTPKQDYPFTVRR